MNNKYQIQIIVPVYNVGLYLDDFIKGIRKQSCQNFRLIVIDDASTDISYEILCRYKKYFGDRMILIKNQKNQGLSGTRNRGLDEASKNPSKYITFLDPDDTIDEKYIEDLFAAAEKYEADLTVSGLKRFEDVTNRLICTEMINYPEELITDSSICDEMAYINPCAYAKLYRFDKIMNVRFTPIKRSEDTCYLFECLPYLRKVKFTNHAYYNYRIRNTSLSGALSEDKLVSMHEYFGKMMPMFEEKKYKRYKQMFETQVFIRSSVGGVSRLSFNALNQAGRLSREELVYLDQFIPGWRRNKFLSIGQKRSINTKAAALKACALLYKLHIFPLFVWCYYFVSQILKKDIRA